MMAVHLSWLSFFLSLTAAVLFGAFCGCLGIALCSATSRKSNFMSREQYEWRRKQEKEYEHE